MQRQEDEEEIQLKPRLQRQEDEEDLQLKPRVQRQEDEEEIQLKPRLQRQEDEEEIQLKTRIQRQPVEEEEIQTKARVQRIGREGGDLDPETTDSIQRSRGMGQPLDEGVRRGMEGAFGSDFGGIRIHADTHAAQLNSSINARAFTVGEDIYFGGGEYNPQSRAGQELIAHELTHTIQQTGGNPLSAPGEGGPPAGGLAAQPRRISRSVLVQRILKDSANDALRNELKTAGKTDEDLEEINKLVDHEPDMDPKKTTAKFAWDYYEKVIKACDLWLEDHRPSTSTPPGDLTNISAIASKTASPQTIEKVKQLREKAFAEQMEAEFRLDFDTKSGTSKGERGKQILAEGPRATKSSTSSETRTSIEMAREEISSSPEKRVRQVNAVLTALSGTPSQSEFEKLQSLMTGGEGIEPLYNATFSPKTLTGDIKAKFKDESQKKYLVKLAKTGEVDVGMEIARNLGETGGPKAQDIFILEAIERFFSSSDLLSSSDTTGFKEQQAEFKKKMVDFENQLLAMGIDVVPGTTGWRNKAPWSRLSRLDIASVTMARIEAAMGFYNTVGAMAEKEAGTAGSVKSDPAATKQLVDSAIKQLTAIVWALTGYMRISEQEKHQMFEKVSDWKKQTTNLEQKFGLAENYIGDQALLPTSTFMQQLQKSGGTSEKLGFYHSDKNYLVNIVGGGIGADVASGTSGQLAKPVQKTIKHEGALKIAQLLQRAKDISFSKKYQRDSDALANEIAKAVDDDPKGVMQYLWLYPGTGESPVADETAWNAKTTDKKIDYANKALERLKKEIGPVMNDRAVEKIIAVFKFGGDVAEEGEAYITIRQHAMTGYNVRHLLERTRHDIIEASKTMSDKDRQYIMADGELRKQLAWYFSSDPNDKKRLEQRLGFELSTGSDKHFFIGGQDLKAATPGTDDLETVDVTDMTETALVEHWVKLFRNAYQRRWTSRTNKTNVRKVAYQAQDAIMKWTKKKFPTPPDAWKTHYADILEKKIKPQLTDKNHLVEYVGENWFKSYDNKIEVGAISEAAMGTIAIDPEGVIAAVEEASGADLLRTFSDIDQFHSLYTAFKNQIEKLKTLSGQEKKDRMAFAMELQHRLLNFTPGVKLSLVTRLEKLKRVRAEERRKIVAAIQDKLSEAYDEDKDVKDKLDEVRNKLGELLAPSSSPPPSPSTPKSEGEQLAESTGGALKKKLLPEEMRAMSMNVEQERGMATTNARRGFEGRWFSGNYAAMEQARAEYLGATRAVSESRSHMKPQNITPQQEQAWQQELAAKLKKVEEAKQKYEEATERFIAFREKVKGYVKLIISLILMAIIMPLTGGAGAAALPVLAQLAIAGFMAVLDQTIDFGFDPESVSLGSAAYKVLTSIAVKAVELYLTPVLDSAIKISWGTGGIYKFWGPTATLANKTQVTGNEFIDGIFHQIWKQSFEKAISGSAQTIADALESQVTTGKGLEAIRDALAGSIKGLAETALGALQGAVTDELAKNIGIKTSEDLNPTMEHTDEDPTFTGVSDQLKQKWDDRRLLHADTGKKFFDLAASTTVTAVSSVARGRGLSPGDSVTEEPELETSEPKEEEDKKDKKRKPLATVAPPTRAPVPQSVNVGEAKKIKDEVTAAGSDSAKLEAALQKLKTQKDLLLLLITPPVIADAKKANPRNGAILESDLNMALELLAGALAEAKKQLNSRADKTEAEKVKKDAAAAGIDLDKIVLVLGRLKKEKEKVGGLTTGAIAALKAVAPRDGGQLETNKHDTEVFLQGAETEVNSNLEKKVNKPEVDKVKQEATTSGSDTDALSRALEHYKKEHDRLDAISPGIIAKMKLVSAPAGSLLESKKQAAAAVLQDALTEAVGALMKKAGRTEAERVRKEVTDAGNDAAKIVLALEHLKRVKAKPDELGPKVMGALKKASATEEAKLQVEKQAVAGILQQALTTAKSALEIVARNSLNGVKFNLLRAKKGKDSTEIRNELIDAQKTQTLNNDRFSPAALATIKQLDAAAAKSLTEIKSEIDEKVKEIDKLLQAKLKEESKKKGKKP
ncbi:MAG: DUF4157 domain-containing protein [Firmicutes bacterium]|nr:DUF4157 domain-containing protein [Bacillota bacterium]